MSIDIPIAEIKPQIHTDAITTGDNTLVDDSTALVNGTALVGGPTTPIGNLSQAIVNTPPKVKIKISR